jgi:hypothetical protein
MDNMSVETGEGDDAEGSDDWQEGFSYVDERDQALDHDRCFLCGADLRRVTRTDEHVFPNWLLRDFNLYEARLNLPNGTAIPYHALRIPCCEECNGGWLGPIETTMATAVRNGPEHVEAVDRITVVLWMIKIFYGLLFKDVALAADLRDPSGDRMLDSEVLRRFAELHRVLQVARRRVDLLAGQLPASLMIFKTLEPEAMELRFDYRDLIAPPFLAIRMGTVGIIACLLDWGAVAGSDLDQVALARELELHPTQFSEVAAICAYWLSRLNRVPKYMAVGRPGGSDQWITLPLGGMSGKPIFDEFEPELYGRLLAEFTGNDLERVWYPDTDELWSGLHTADGTPLQLSRGDAGMAMRAPKRA